MTPIDAESAWKLIRAIRHHGCKAPGVLKAGLHIRPDGRWSADHAVTPEAALLLDMLLPLACSSASLVIAQIGQSLDGRTATVSGHSRYVTGYASRVHLHRLRALVDAVVIGANTAIQDNPQLTVRHVAGDNPVRVVLDPNGRVPHHCHVFTDGGPPTWHAVRAGIAAAPGARRLALPQDAADIPGSLLAGLASRGMSRVLIEGGGTTISRFIEAGCVDRLHIVVAPFIIGSGRPGLSLREIDTLDDALRPQCRSFAIGEDQLYDLILARAGRPRTST
ncbi:MAG: RibD family protein [Castellaniella sp.]|uniref:RibD family protein n=1 Tax=Castellaniella sp. TaxID=1955812 RepID=UPI0012281602|nr:RibD family protein [Castellaniella sp.]TAN27574.1 MAG: RibD family protein [Castellaniella sp.]